MHASCCACVAVRIDWRPEDPEIVSDVLFAVANVMSIARTTYMMPAFEVLGPLQISLGRMLGDITRFLVLFTLVRIYSTRAFFLYAFDEKKAILGWRGGLVLGRRTCDLVFAGSRPGRDAAAQQP